MKNAMVVGGGLVGACLSVVLSKKGYKVKVFERRSDIRQAEISAGKSINLALSDRGWKAMEMIGAREKVEEFAIPMYGRLMHAKDGSTNFQPYGKENQAIYSVSRGLLNATLLEIADENPDVELHFNSKCAGVDLQKGTVDIIHTDQHETVHYTGDVMFGTDGAFSAVRSEMQRTDRFDYSQRFMKHGYKELLLPSKEDGGYRLDPNALHIWPREDFMLIALPNEDGSFTCTLFMPYEGENAFENLKSNEQIDRFFQEQFPDFYELMPDLVQDYHEHPLSSLVIIKCYPWSRGKALILGDAAHAIVPFYGQGMNAGFEDCSILSNFIDDYEGDWSKVFSEFEKFRKPDADAISELALQNYIEMRDSVADEQFLLRKKIESKFAEKHPDKWQPLYSQVTFSHRRYHEALENGRYQDRIMDRVMATPGIEDKWDSDEVEELILELLRSN